VIWHYHRCMQKILFLVIMEAVSEDQFAGRMSKRFSRQFSERDENWSAMLLIMWQPSTIDIVPIEHSTFVWRGHSCRRKGFCADNLQGAGRLCL